MGVFTPIRKDADKHFQNVEDIFKLHIEHVDKSTRRYRFDYGGGLDFWSLPNIGSQENGRGEGYDLVVYDEYQKLIDAIAKHHLEFVIMPLLLDNPNAKVVMFGTPNGKGTYWHELASRGAFNGLKHGVLKHANDLNVSAKNNSSWITMRLPTDANPHLSKKRIAEMRLEFDTQTAQQELDAIFIDYAGEIWCSALKNSATKKRVFKKGLTVDWSDTIYLNFDFNKQPMTASLMQLPVLYQHEDQSTEHNGMFIRGVRLIKTFETNIENKSSIFDLIRIIQHWIYEQTGVKIGRWYSGSMHGHGIEGERHEWTLQASNPCHFDIMFTGDASGDDDGDGRQKAARDYYDILAKEFNASQATQFRIPKKNPLHAESYIQYNLYLQRCPIFEVDEVQAVHLKNDMLQVKSDKFRGIVKSDKRLTHHLDNSRYGLNTWQHLIVKY